MRSRAAVLLLCLVLFVSVVYVSVSSHDPLAERYTPGGEEAVASALERIRRTGSFNHPAYPWVVRARRVQGNTLEQVEFLCRDQDGKTFAAVGKAFQVTVRYSRTYHGYAPSFIYLGDPPPTPIRRDTLEIRAHQFLVCFPSGDEAWWDDQLIDLFVPPRLREADFRPFSEAEARLTGDQHQVLAREYPLRPEQKKVLAVFGDEDTDLIQGDILETESGRTLMAYPRERIDTSPRGDYLFSRLAVARFDRAGGVTAKFRGDNVTLDPETWRRLWDEQSSVTLTGADGRTTRIPSFSDPR
jgi:hypothetical protein